MTVSADEEFGGIRVENVADAWIVFARISSYVSHQHVSSFAIPSQFFRVKASQVTSVDVAMHSSQRTEFLQFHGHFQRTDITRMPYLVTLLEVFQITVIPVCVGITKQSYSFHDSLF